MTIRAFAPAKINLALHVTGQRADGFHLLDSLVCFADVGDVITVAPADNLRLQISGPMAAGMSAGADNLVLRAARLLGPGRGADIKLEKNLPVAAGIGGGSADAAAALHALAQLWACPLPSGQDLTGLGADVPVCVGGTTARMTGIGSKVKPVNGFPTLFGLLVNPGVAVSTSDVFKALKTKDNQPLEALPKAGADWIEYLRRQRNDLQIPAQGHAPVIADVLRAIDALGGCRLARMSGSGASCFGLFSDEAAAKKARDALSADHPKWWVRAVSFGALSGDV